MSVLVLKAVRAGARQPAPCQRPQAGRKVKQSAACGPVHQDRDDVDTAVQRGLDLQADEIVGVVQAPLPVPLGDRQPPLADDSHQGRARRDSGRDHLGEVIAGLK